MRVRTLVEVVEDKGGDSTNLNNLPYGLNVCIRLGNAIASGMCRIPEIHATVRSIPSPNPECTKLPRTVSDRDTSRAPLRGLAPRESAPRAVAIVLALAELFGPV